MLASPDVVRNGEFDADANNEECKYDGGGFRSVSNTFHVLVQCTVYSRFLFSHFLYFYLQVIAILSLRTIQITMVLNIRNLAMEYAMGRMKMTRMNITYHDDNYDNDIFNPSTGTRNL